MYILCARACVQGRVFMIMHVLIFVWVVSNETDDFSYFLVIFF